MSEVKPELHYGKNVEWFLNELAAYETTDLDSGEFDVYGENEHGTEGSASIDITLLAADAVKLIATLKAERDALAVESAALKEYLKECSVVEGQGNWTSDAEKSVYAPAADWMPPTPATDVYLNSVRSDAINHAGKMIMATMNHQDKGVERALECLAQVEMSYIITSQEAQ